MPRDLVGGEMPAAMLDQHLRVQIGVAFDDDDLDRFAGVRIGQTNCADFQDAGMQAYDVFDLVGKYLEAGYDDKILDAIDDANETVLVDGRHVAGAQESIGSHDLVGLVRTLPIALHHLRAAHAQLAGLPELEFIALLVADRDLG